MIKVWGGIFIIAGLVGGCTAKGDDAPSVPSPEPTYAVPSEIGALLVAVGAGDVEAVRSHLAFRTDPGGWSVGDMVPLACARIAAESLSAALPATTSVSEPKLVHGVHMRSLWFQHASGGTGWVISQHGGEWYVMPDTSTCLETASPSPSPS